MNRLLSWKNKSSDGTQAREIQEESRMSMDNVREYLRYFPLGTRLQYYPEYEKNIQLDTVMLAYRLDGILVYNNRDLRFSQAEENQELLFKTESGERVVSNIESFRFVVPKSHRTLVDYTGATEPSSEKKFTERTVNDFRIGNTITLLNKGTKGKMVCS